MVHGSLQYWPHRRARKRLARLRSNPDMKEPTISNLVAYKVGMTHVAMTDDSESPSKNQEVARAVTVLEIPKTEVYGLRFYGVDGISNYKIIKTELYNKAAAQRLNIKKLQNDESKLDAMKGKIKEFSDVRILAAAYPKETSAEQHHPMRFEAAIGGKSIEEKFDAASKLLGKEVRITDVFKPGEFIDVSTVTKGKGWQGPIKRFGVKRKVHKATGKIRTGGPLGSMGLGKVFYTVPRAGQLGFNYRTEHNKRILKLGKSTDAEAINKPGGFVNYGVVRNDYVVVDGSVGGPAKRLVRIRKSIRERNAKGIKEPKVSYIAK